MMAVDALPKSAHELDFSDVYREWFRHVCRWIRALGGFGVDHEDLAQEVFLVVRRKLSAFDGRNISGWLYRITELTVRGSRRRAWAKRMVLGRRETAGGELVAQDRGPAGELQRKEARRILAEILSSMSDERRVAFMLFEIEGYSGEEIASMQGVPTATVWTRLHYARKEFLAGTAEHDRRQQAEEQEQEKAGKA